VNDKKYVGMTLSIEDEWRNHHDRAIAGDCSLLHCEIRNVGHEAFDVLTLGSFDDKEQAQQFIKDSISELRTSDPKFGYNDCFSNDKRQKMSPEEYSRFRANIARRVNKARGTPEHIQSRVRALYFEKRMTAKQVANEVGISHGAVRSIISRAYSSMSVEERVLVCKNAGRWTGELSR
jgi:hypothetical protein